MNKPFTMNNEFKPTRPQVTATTDKKLVPPLIANRSKDMVGGKIDPSSVFGKKVS